MADTLDPVNFEDYLTEYLKKAGENAQKFIDIPSDDIEVCLAARKIRTIRPLLPDYSDLNDQEDLYINECMRCYTSNWVVVLKK